MGWWTSNYALYPADRLLVRTSVRMTLSAPPNAMALTCGRGPKATIGFNAFMGGVLPLKHALARNL